MLAKMGVAMVWQHDDVHPRHRRWGKVPVRIKQNCPYVDKKWGKRLINEVENDIGKPSNYVLCILAYLIMK